MKLRHRVSAYRRDGHYDPGKARPWRIAGVLVLIGAEALLYGYSYPFFSLALEKRELANWLIGLNASLASVGILLVGPFLPQLIHRFGLKHVVAVMFAVSIFSFGVLLFVDHLTMWFLARFVMGTCFAALWTTTEIWLNGVVSDRHRGRIIGASGTLYATCQFIGPLVLGGVGVTGPLPLVVAMAPLAVGVAVALSIGSPKGSPEDDEPAPADTHNLGLALSVAGGLVAAAFLCGIGETAMQSLLPLYGLAHGFDDAGAARLVALFSLGEAILVAGLGWMADHYGRRMTLRLCVLVATFSTLAIPVVVDVIPLLWAVLFFAGGTVAGIYTLGIVLIGEDFRGHTLAVVSTGFAMAYAAGSIFGAAPVGYLIDLFGPEALPLAVAIGFVGLSTYLFLGDGSQERTGRGPQAAVPNLKYLEDSQFEDDETAQASGTDEAEPEEAPLADASPFRPTHSATPPLLGLPPLQTELDLPVENFEEQMRRRRAEIAEIVARRHKSRETQQSRARPPPANEPPQERKPPNDPFAPPPRSNDEEA